jgi:hypothetical protein
MVAHICNSSTQEDWKFEATLQEPVSKTKPKTKDPESQNLKQQHKKTQSPYDFDRTCHYL